MQTRIKYPKYMDVKKNKIYILEDSEFIKAYSTILDLEYLNAEILHVSKKGEIDFSRPIRSTDKLQDDILLIINFGVTKNIADYVGFQSRNKITITRKSEVTNALALKKIFNCPEFYYSSDPSKIIYDLDPDKNYILKSLYQALGYGKILFNPIKDTNIVEDIIMSYRGQNSDFLTQHGDIEKKEEESELRFSTKHYFIMEDIGYETIKEFRILLTSYGYYYIQDRNGYHPHDKNKREFINLNEPIDETIIPKNDMEDILTKLRLVMYELEAPFMSFDLYVRLDVPREDFYNRYGCFECSLEFGHTVEYVKLLQLRKAMTISLYNFCMYKIKPDGKFLDFIGGEKQKAFEQITV